MIIWAQPWPGHRCSQYGKQKGSISLGKSANLQARNSQVRFGWFDIFISVGIGSFRELLLLPA